MPLADHVSTIIKVFELEPHDPPVCSLNKPSNLFFYVYDFIIKIFSIHIGFDEVTYDFSCGMANQLSLIIL